MMSSSGSNGPLTVLQAVPRWLPQTEKWIYDAVKTLSSDIESHIVCEDKENLDQFFLANLHSRSDMSWGRQLWDRCLDEMKGCRHQNLVASLARRYRAEVLHSHFGHVGWEYSDAARRLRLKHVVSFYGFDMSYLPAVDPRWRQRYLKLFEQADSVLCEGPSMAQSLVALGCPAQKVRVHHLGVMLDALPFKPRRWKEGEPLRVLIAGSFQEKKGIPYALAALGQVHRRKIPLEVTIIGDATAEARSQAEKQKILAAIRAHELDATVRLFGYQPHAALLREAYGHHVLVASSVTARDGDTEGGAPVTLIEMAATGMPIVSTRHCDIPEVIRHGRTGLLAEEKDIDGLAAQLFWLIEHRDRWLPLLEACRRHVEAEYDCRVQGERLAEVYRGLVAA